MIRVKVDDRRMKRFVKQMPKAGKRVIARSMNKAVTMARTAGVREIASRRNILAGMARKQMRIVRANPGRLEASVDARGSPIKVIKVKGAKRQKKDGVLAKIDSKRKPHLFKNHFIATMPSGHVGIFVRESDPRLPLREATLPSVPATMVTAEVDRAMRLVAGPVFVREVARLLEIEMVKAGAR